MTDLALLDLLEEELLPLVLAGGVLECGQLDQLPVARDVEPGRALPPLLQQVHVRVSQSQSSKHAANESESQFFMNLSQNSSLYD